MSCSARAASRSAFRDRCVLPSRRAAVSRPAVRAAVDDPYPVDALPRTATSGATCEQKRLDEDHLSLVAGIRRGQVDRLAAAGISTRARSRRSPRTRTFPSATGNRRAPPRAGASSSFSSGSPASSCTGAVLPGQKRGLARCPRPHRAMSSSTSRATPFGGQARPRIPLWTGLARRGRGAFPTPSGPTDRPGEQRAFERLVDL